MARLITRAPVTTDPIPQEDKTTLDSFQRAVWLLSMTNLTYRDFAMAFGPALAEMNRPVPVVEPQLVEISHNKELR